MRLRIVCTSVSCQRTTEITALANALGIPVDFKKLLQDERYDCGLILLGDKYLEACNPFQDWTPAFQTLLIGSAGWVKKVNGITNVKCELANQKQATKYGAGVTSVKGKSGSLIIQKELKFPGAMSKCVNPKIGPHKVI